MSESTPPVRDHLRSFTPFVATWPLTYDESDDSGGNAFARLAGGPLVTPDGFRGNGYDGRLMLSSLPPWLASAGAPLAFYCRAAIRSVPRSSREVFATLAPATADQPKVELALAADPTDATLAVTVLRAYGSSLVTRPLVRRGYRFEFQWPELVGGFLPSAQALLWLDANTLLSTAHVSDTASVLYRVDRATGEYTGRASSTVYRHIGSLAKDAAGRVWATDSASGGAGYTVFELDLDGSFASGAITATSSAIQVGMTANGGLAFVTVASVELVVLAEYATSGTPWLYVLPASVLSGAVDASGRIKRFSIGLRVQDCCIRANDGLLYASRNVKQSGGTAGGYVQSYDLASALATLADGATLSPVATYPHATGYAEGVDFEPITDRLWVSTEGLSAVSDQRSHVAVWSTAIPQEDEENGYLVDLVDGMLELRVNRRLMVTLSPHLPSVAPARLAVGAPPGAVAGLSNGFLGRSTLRALAVSNESFSEAILDTLDAGDGEPNALEEHALSLVNPDGEAGSTIGWTEELAGLLALRASNPAPIQGFFYFMGVGGTHQRCRQRLALPAGLSNPFVVIDWEQASYDAASDPGGVALRALDSSGSELGYFPSAEIVVAPSQTWRSRSLSVELPAGTTHVDVLQFRTRTAGSNVDTYLDSIAVRVFDR